MKKGTRLFPAFFGAMLATVSTPTRAAPDVMSREEIICLAQSGVGFSYWWGHGAWCRNECSPDFSCGRGSCSGSCPSCTHTGNYGADCSGFVAKVWQVPGPSPTSTNSHPYSTRDFRCSSIHWSQIDKRNIEIADALVYREGGCPGSSGHVMIYERGDPWGYSWTYEARGCSYGIVHNNRSVSSEYIAIRRNNLAPDCTPQPETCDGQDNDCDGNIDEEYVPFTCGLGICERESACSGGTEFCSPGPSEPETCDGQDNNCDGNIDEGDACSPVVPEIPTEEFVEGGMEEALVEENDRDAEDAGVDVEKISADTLTENGGTETGAVALKMTGGCACHIAY